MVKKIINHDWNEFQGLWCVYFIILLLCRSRPHPSPHEQWFIRVFVCHKLIYTLLWWLWAAHTQRFIKYPSPRLIQVCLIFKAPGASSFVLQSVYFPTCYPAAASRSLTRTQTTSHTNGSLMRCLTMKMTDTEDGPSVGQRRQWIMGLIYECIKCYNVKSLSHLLMCEILNQINTITNARQVP